MKQKMCEQEHLEPMKVVGTIPFQEIARNSVIAHTVMDPCQHEFAPFTVLIVLVVSFTQVGTKIALRRCC